MRDGASLLPSVGDQCVQRVCLRFDAGPQLCQQRYSSGSTANQELTAFYRHDGHKALFSKRDRFRDAQSLRCCQRVLRVQPRPCTCQRAGSNSLQ